MTSQAQVSGTHTTEWQSSIVLLVLIKVMCALYFLCQVRLQRSEVRLFPSSKSGRRVCSYYRICALILKTFIYSIYYTFNHKVLLTLDRGGGWPQPRSLTIAEAILTTTHNRAYYVGNATWNALRSLWAEPCIAIVRWWNSTVIPWDAW